MKKNFVERMIVAAVLLAWTTGNARASIAYGSINNFDTVNDTGVEAHGFEIELDDIHSADITYTFDWNHYGTAKIAEDNSVPGHPRTTVRWESAKKPDGTWTAYTAVPAGPIAPTQGHQFTDPSVNFGGEHFGTGYRVPPSAVRYHWLIDNGSGALVAGPPVQVATPVFVYVPAVAAVPAQVQVAIAPPVPPAPPPREFGEPVWVKEIRTTSHNANKVALRDLVSDDPADPNDRNWRNGEPDEVEAEWELLQKDYNQGDGGPKAKLNAAPEELPNGNEVVTRRYEFYKYVGPIDAETGEAMADSVAKDGIHGTGTKEINGVATDLSQVEVVGDFAGAQMAAVDVDAGVGLIDHLQDGELDSPYPDRTVVVAGNAPFQATTSGALPVGMAFDPVTGVVSGTPTESGEFSFTVNVEDAATPQKSKTYLFRVAAAGALPPQAVVDPSAEPVAGGTTSGGGTFGIGDPVSLTATANPGFVFVNWTEDGKVVSSNATYEFAVDINHSPVAHFAPAGGFTITTSALPTDGGTTAGGGTFQSGAGVTVSATPGAGYSFVDWTDGGVSVSVSANYTFTAGADRTLVANFLANPPSTPVNAVPAAGATGISLTPELGSSGFVAGLPGTTHAASEWVLREAGGGAVVFESGRDTAHLTSITIPSPLAWSSSYEWQVRYQDSAGSWSGYSAATPFTTKSKPPVSFQSVSGTYSGLLEGETSQVWGTESLALSGTGVLSTSFTFHGKVYRVTGAMSSDGSFSKVVNRPGLPSLTVSLVLDPATDQITGTISDGTDNVGVLLNRSVYSKTNLPPPALVGSYTLLLPPDPLHPEAASPQGSGYGRLTVGKTGVVSFTGFLGDGLAVTCSATLSKAATATFFAAPYAFGGGVSGWLTFRDVPHESDVDGDLHWTKGVTSKPTASTRYAAGFEQQIGAVGAKYTPPLRGQRAIPLPEKVDNASIAITGGNLSQPMPVRTVTLDVSNHPSVAPGLILRWNTTTGLFSGSFTVPGATKSIPVAGALFQKADADGFGRAAGVFVGRGETGIVSLAPKP